MVGTPFTLLCPFQIWQGIDIETKMHVRFLNMETMALCH